MKLSEKDKTTAFAVLAIVALAVVAYVFFFSNANATEDKAAADAKPFYSLLVNSSKVGVLYDVRGADDAQAQSIYQCGVNIISKGAFAGKDLQVIGCDANGCLSSNQGNNSSSQMNYQQALSSLSGKPYILIDGASESGLKYFQKHLQITLGKNVTSAGANCSLAIE
ncbi:MAG: hypothetical protein NTV88_01490 [Candidatus Micrarchaeota archaeon]|nr:hypothetical protein [Candidatus Micrarchaeota archaeon]